MRIIYIILYIFVYIPTYIYIYTYAHLYIDIHMITYTIAAMFLIQCATALFTIISSPTVDA